jgi:hypothetical protein
MFYIIFKILGLHQINGRVVEVEALTSYQHLLADTPTLVSIQTLACYCYLSGSPASLLNGM